MYRKKYIYERELWPDLEWDWAALSDAVARVYLLRGSLHGKLDALGFSVRNELLLNSVSDEVLKSSEIEGEKLDMAGVRSSVARRLGIDSAGIGDVYPDHYTEGVVEMVIDAVQDYKLRLTDERLFGWHAALFPVGYSGSRHIIVGAYRKSDMEIVSGPFGKEQVHFTAPKPERVEPEMKAFLKWIEGEQGIDPVIKAGLAHLRFVTIHPFDDGNGRIGRAIADMMLARAEGDANRYYSLSSRMSAEKNEYYNALEEAQTGTGDVTDWLEWFLGCLSRAIEGSERSLDAAVEKARFFENWKSVPMNERQLRMVNMLLDGFEGKLRTSKWAKITKCSQDTALRDIDDLVQKSILTKEGDGRSTSYSLIRKQDDLE